MYHAPSKRKQLAQRITVYSIMSLAVIVLVTILFFFMMGYRFNRVDGRIQQGGLVQFESIPGSADVEINGKRLGTRTSAKTTLAAGPHTILMQRDGYQRWQKSIDVKPGSVLWLNYARLIPLTLTPTNVADFTKVTSTAASPNKKWMAIKDDTHTPIISIADLSQPEPRMSELTLPKGSFTAPEKPDDQQFVLQKWDVSSRRLLVKHTYDSDKVEWLVVDAQRVENTKNLTALLGVNASTVVFHPTDTGKVYVQVDNEVRIVDLTDATLSGPLVKQVQSFTPYLNDVLYTTRLDADTKERTIGYYDSSARLTRTLRTYTGEPKGNLHIAVGKYFETTYIALAHGDTVEVMQGNLPRSAEADISTLTTVAAMTVPSGVLHLSSATNGRFIVAQSATAYVVHDLELSKTTRTILHHESEVKRQLDWLDNYTLVSDQEGMLRTYEFDGANQHDIMPVVPGTSVTLSPNGTYLYGISQSEDGYHLIRVRLILQ